MLDIINKFVWGFASVFLVFFGIFYTIKFKGVQFRFLDMFKALFCGAKGNSNFGILMTSLAGRIGVGSISGVALSIYIGGVGSIFWMWVTCFLCAVITFCESFLGVKYKLRDGAICRGGPAYYIRDGMHKPKLGGIYAVLIIVSYIGCFLGIQANTITKSVCDYFVISPVVVALVVVVVSFFCIGGGYLKISNVCMKIVPIMTVIYLFSALYVFFVNIDNFPIIMKSILISAFNFKSLFGGFFFTFIVGMQRGIFSNESGIGTASIVASTSTSDQGYKEGLVQVFGTYITTILICTATAIFILNSNYEVLNLSDLNGIEITQFAFNFHFGNLGIYILIISILFFSFSTILTGYYYGESCLKYFFSDIKLIYIYILRFLTLLVLFVGCLIPSSFLWNVVDIFVGIIVLINLYAIWCLRRDITYNV